MSQPSESVDPRSTCETVQELLGAEHDGEAVLDPVSAEHARGCETCGELRNALRGLSDAIAPLRAELRPPAGLWARIEERAARRPTRPASRPARALSSLGASLLGAAAVVALLAALDAKREANAVRLRSGLTRPFELLAAQGSDATRRLAAVPELRLAHSLSPPEDHR